MKLEPFLQFYMGSSIPHHYTRELIRISSIVVWRLTVASFSLMCQRLQTEVALQWYCSRDLLQPDYCRAT